MMESGNDTRSNIMKLPPDRESLDRSMSEYDEESIINLMMIVSKSEEELGDEDYARFGRFLKNWANFNKMEYEIVSRPIINGTHFKNINHLARFINFSHQLFDSLSSYPVQLYFDKKQSDNLEGQFRAINMLIDLPKEIFSFSEFSGRLIVPLKEFPVSLSDLSSSSWNSYDFFEYIFQMIGKNYFNLTKTLFEKAMKQSPDLLCIALSIFNPPQESILNEILIKMISGYIIGQYSSNFVLQRIWQNNPQIVTMCMTDIHRKDSLSSSRLLDVALELKMLNKVLTMKSYIFSIDLAILASRRQHLNLEKWVREQAENADFARGCLEYIHFKTKSCMSPVIIDNIGMLTKLIKQTGRMSESEISALETAITGASAATNFHLPGSSHSTINCGPPPQSFLPAHSNYPNLFNIPGHLNLSSPSQPSQQQHHHNMASFHPDVENIVNGYFESLFASQLSAEDLVKVLRNLKLSANVHERQIYDCLIRNLFEEFKFFPNYPEKELETVAVFVGQIIASDLLHPTSQSTALTFVLDALKKPVNSRLFQFAQLSLSHFYRRVPEWTQFMEALVRSSNYEFLPEAIRSYLMAASQPDSALDGVDGIRAALFSSPLQTPPDKVKERIHFLINNLTEETVIQKAQEISGLLEEGDYNLWFVDYIMSERIILEANFHTLYHELVSEIKSFSLLDSFMSSSLSKARRLLLSFDSLGEKRDSIQFRSVLKNLAQWIGLLFFSRDRPILRKDLCIRTLLTSQSSNDYYTFVLPFTCKLLEKTSLSAVLCPSNPWIASLLRLLVEIYLYIDLKLNSKFEIELLFKSIGIEMKGIQPSNILRRRLSRPTSVILRNSQSVPINEIVAEIGPAQVERVCAIAIKTVTAMIMKDEVTGVNVGRVTGGIAGALLDANGREAARTILLSAFRKYMASGPVDESRLMDLVEASLPTVMSATHELIQQATRSIAFSAPSTSQPSAVVANVYQELLETVSRSNNLPSPVDIASTVASILGDIESLVSKSTNLNVSEIGPDHEVKILMKRLVSLAATDTQNRDEACLLISQRLIQLLFKTSNLIIIDIAIVLLAKIFEYSSRVSKEVTNWILVSTDERKFNVAAMAALLASGLIYVLDFDVQLARHIEGSTSKAIPFAIELVRKCILSNSPIAAPYDMVYALEALGRAMRRIIQQDHARPVESSKPSDKLPDSRAQEIMALMEDISKKISDPASATSGEGKVREVVSFWFSDWFRLCQYPLDSSKQVASFLTQLAQKDYFFRKCDKAVGFFRICAEVAVELFLHQKHSPSVLSLRGVDCYVRLAVGLSTMPEKRGLVGEPELLRLAICEFISVLLTVTDQQPIVLRAHARLLSVLLSDLSKCADLKIDLKAYHLIVADILDAINPCSLPVGLAAWIDAVANKHYLQTWLFDYPDEGNSILGRSILFAVDFLSQPDIVSGLRSPTLVTAYQAILRLLVGIAHDRPEVLLLNSRDILCRLDSHYIQLRNLVLATIPLTLALPDPFAADFSFDRIANSLSLFSHQLIPVAPISSTCCDQTTMTMVEGAVSKCVAAIAMDVDGFSRLPNSHNFLFSAHLFALLSNQKQVVTVDRLADGLGASIHLMMDNGQGEEAYRLLFALTDNLRFPCAETHFFIRLFLALFVNASDFGKEMITRVLLERLIVHKPHPWGLIVVFLELIKRSDIGFWKCPFTSKTPEIRRMFESVAKTCGSTVANRK